jgi:hypothetical protein
MHDHYLLPESVCVMGLGMGLYKFIYFITIIHINNEVHGAGKCWFNFFFFHF